MTAPFDPYHEWLGIPPKDQPPHFYRLLGVELFESNLSVIEHAADRQMAHVRTFQSGKKSGVSQKLLNELAKAKVTLLAPDSKAAYDAKLHAQMQAQAIQSAAPVASPPPPAMGHHTPTPPQDPAPPSTQTPSSLMATRRHGRGRSRKLWQHPAVLASIVVGSLLVAIGLFVLIAGGGDPDSGPDVAQNPEGGENESSTTDSATDADPGASTGASITGTFGVESAVDAASFGRPDTETVNKVHQAWGMTSSDYALCQTGLLSELQPIAESMFKTGFRLIYLRPYEHKDQLKFAAIWRCDGRPWRVALGRSPDEVRAIDAKLQKQGYVPVDVAGYGASPKYAAVWCIPGVGGKATEMNVGEPHAAWHSDGDTIGITEKRRQDDWVLQTKQVCYDESGNRFDSGVWKRGDSNEDRSTEESETLSLSQAVSHQPVAATVAFNRKNSTPLYSVTWQQQPVGPKAWEVLSESSTSKLLPLMRSRLSEEMEPYSLDVASEGDRVTALAIWNLKRGATPSLRLKELMSSRGGSSTVAEDKPPAAAERSDALAASGLGGLEIGDSSELAGVGTNFTAEMWVRLAQHPTESTTQCLMGTARGSSLVSGWQLIAIENRGGSSPRSRQQSRLEIHTVDPRQTASYSVLGDFSKWRHVAVCGKQSGSSWSITAYVDGSRAGMQVISGAAATEKSGHPLMLGAHPTGAAGQTFYGAIKQFRLSVGDRYESRSFSPEPVFAKDDDTRVLLTFDQSVPDTLKNLVQEGENDGTPLQTTWIADVDDLVPHPGIDAAATAATVKPTNVAQEPVVRKPAPDLAEVGEITEQIREIFKDDYEKATTPVANAVLSDTLQKKAQDEDDDATRFAMLREAATKAIEGKNIPMAISLVEGLEREYEVSLWEDRHALIERAFEVSRVRIDRIAVAQAAHGIAEDAMKRDELDVAANLLDKAYSEVRQLRANELAKAIAEKTRVVKAIRDEHRNVQAAEVKIASGAAVGVDYRRAGVFYCFLKDDWKKGLELLAQSSDNALQPLAETDISEPTDGGDRLKLADDWKAAGDTLENDEQNGAWKRAHYWYSRALPDLTGIDKVRAEKLLGELEGKVTGLNANASPSSLSILDRPPGVVHKFVGHSQDVVALDVSKSGHYAASVDGGGALLVWDVFTGQRLHQLEVPGTRRVRLQSVRITPDEKYVLAGTSANSVAAWNLKSGEPAFAIPASSGVVDLDVSQDGNKVIVATQTSTGPNVGVFSLRTRKTVGVLKCRTSPRFVRFSKDSLRAVTVDLAGEVALWNLLTFTLVGTYAVPGGSVNAIAFSPDDRYVAIAASSDVVHIWNPNTQRLETTLDDANSLSSVRGLDITGDGRHIAVADYYSGVVVWNTDQKKVVARSGGRSSSSSYREFSKIALLSDSRGALVSDQSNGLALIRLPDY